MEQLSARIQYAYLNEFCSTILSLYGNILDDAERKLLTTLTELAPAASWRAICLLSRKHPFFSLPDVKISSEEKEELLQRMCIGSLPSSMHTQECLEAVSKQRLLEACTVAKFGVSPNDKKLRILQKISWMKMVPVIASKLDLYQIFYQEAFEVLKILMFGSSASNFGKFFSRDALSYRPAQAVGSLRPYLVNRQQLEGLRTLEKFKNAESDNAENYWAWMRKLANENFLHCDHLKIRATKHAEREADKCERSGRLTMSLDLWRMGSSLLSVSGTLRVMKKLGLGAEVITTARSLLAGRPPGPVSEFLTEVLERNTADVLPKHRTSRRQTLHTSPKLVLEGRMGAGIESDTCEQLRTRGLQAFHTENWLFQKFFNHFFETQLLRAGICSGFTPLGFPIFNPCNEDVTTAEKIEELIDKLDESWRPSETVDPAKHEYPLQLFYLHTPLPVQKKLLKIIVKDPKHALSGYPDLLVLDGSMLEFIEVKGPSDVVRIEQVAAAKRLDACGIKTSVLRVSYVETLPQLSLPRRRSEKRLQISLFI